MTGCRRSLRSVFFHRSLSVFIAGVGISLAVFFTIHLLYSSYCAMTWGKFAYKDYGVYTNMIWNSGHGCLFACGLDDSYLYTHLAFSLALLGPLFRLWNDPFLLAFAQWCMLVTGALILWKAGRRRGLKTIELAALLFFFTGYRFTQSVLLSEFHTVSTYFLLVPWLYYCLAFRKGMVWLPLAMILGVREDAFVFILPMLLYFAIRDKWKWGYVYMAVALFYGLAAVFVIYPRINDGLSIISRRSNYLDPGRWNFLECDAILRRLHAVVLTGLPVLLFSGLRAYIPIVFCITGLLSGIFSSWPSQQALGGIYSATVIVCLVPGMLESRSAAASDRVRLVRSFLLIAVTVLVHLYSGFTMFGGKAYHVYQSPRILGQMALDAARHLPREGTLLTERKLMGFCSNRARLVSTTRYEDSGLQFDVAFMNVDALRQRLDGELIGEMKRGELGLSYYDGAFVILEKGHDTSENREFLEKHYYGPIFFALTPGLGGRDIYRRGKEPVRYWVGAGHRAPITLSYGGKKWLPAGRYRALFRYRAGRPKKTHSGSWGTFSIHHFNDQGPAVVEAGIDREEAGRHGVSEQYLEFDIAEAGDIEVRVTGGDARLWLYRAEFIPLQ